MIPQLEVIRQQQDEAHRLLCPPTGFIAVGGAHMDYFFRYTAVDACIRALRAGKSVADAVAAGKEASRQVVRNWNKRREHQVHRWEETAFDWLDAQIRLLSA